MKILTRRRLLHLPLGITALPLWPGMASEPPSPSPGYDLEFYGFGPFAGRAQNASWLSVKGLQSQAQPQAPQTRATEMKVTWGQPAAALQTVGRRTRPYIVVGVGEGESDFRIELKAYNERGHYPDVSGVLPPSAAIKPGGSAILENPLHTGPLIAAMKAQGYVLSTSENAGRYLCNEFLYTALDLKSRDPHLVAVLFIHVPVLGTAFEKNGVRVVFDAVECGCFGKALLSAIRTGVR